MHNMFPHSVSLHNQQTLTQYYTDWFILKVFIFYSYTFTPSVESFSFPGIGTGWKRPMAYLSRPNDIDKVE